MHIVDRERDMKQFLSFVDYYDANDKKIERKHGHTIRVANIADKIASKMHVSDAERDLIWLCGLLHDFGRFEQATKYGTYNDATSTNHAIVSADMLFHGLVGDRCDIRQYIESDVYDDNIERALAAHNAREISDGLSGIDYLLTSVLMDADKIDNINMMSYKTTEEVCEESSDDVLSSEFSDIAMNAFMQHRTLDNKNERKTPADKVLSKLAFIFGLYNKVSFDVLLSYGKLEKIFNAPYMLDISKFSDTAQANWQMSVDEIKRYIATRLC